MSILLYFEFLILLTAILVSFTGCAVADYLSTNGKIFWFFNYIFFFTIFFYQIAYNSKLNFCILE